MLMNNVNSIIINIVINSVTEENDSKGHDVKIGDRKYQSYV